MNATEIQHKVHQILWGKFIAEVTNAEGLVKPFVLRSLTSHEINYLDFLYNRELRLAIEDGLLLELDLCTIYEDNGLWAETDEIHIKGLQNKIDIIKNQIRQCQFMKNKKKKYERDLKKTKNELENKNWEKNQLFMLSAENRAEEIKRRYMIMISSENINGEPYWESEESFLNEIDSVLMYNLAIAYYKNNILSESETREIARSGTWRFRWQAAKKGSDLFGKPVSEWSDMQNALVYWSQFYDIVYESGERPDQSIIDDDNACDAWYDDYIKRMSNNNVNNESRSPTGIKKSKLNKIHQEQFIFVDENDSESIEKVQNMNAPSIREKLKSERQKIESSKGGRLSEWNLRKRDYLVGGFKQFTKVKSK